MASAEIEDIREELYERKNDHSFLSRFRVRNISSTPSKRYSLRTSCNINSTLWEVDVQFRDRENKYIVFHLILARLESPDLGSPVCVCINVSATSNKGQRTETENTIKDFRKGANSSLSMQFPHEMASSPDIELNVRITVTISGCCTLIKSFN